MRLRQIRLKIESAAIGEGFTWSYPKDDGKIYVIPTYRMRVIGTDAHGTISTEQFEVFRFGVHRPSVDGSAHVVGLADPQVHTARNWIRYSVHSARSEERGAWHVFGNYLIHDGPDDPRADPSADPPYATIGCVEVCGGPRGFDMFNNLLISWSGSREALRESALRQIGKSGLLTIDYAKALRPLLRVWKGEKLKSPRGTH